MNAYDRDAAMTCQEFRAALPAYRAGELSEAQSLAMEAHAAACETSEALMDDASPIDVSGFAPPLPPDLRERVMASVTSTAAVETAASLHVGTRKVRRWRTLGVILAAAATLLVFVRMPAPDVVRSGAESTTVATRDTVQAAERIVEESARPELEEIDRAASEIEAALAATPNDRELEAFLSTIRARRSELTQHIKDWKS